MKVLESLKRQIIITHISGVPVRIDWRWFFVFLLMIWLISARLQPLTENYPTSIVFGFLTSIALFGSILFHEIAHGYAARREGIGVVEIVLHPFGGLTRLQREPSTPRAEFRIAFAGPLASFVLAFLFLGLMLVFKSPDTNILSEIFVNLCLLNFLLAIFNLFPGYPLDGGRVLRSFLWKRGRDLNEATILTGRFGQFIAIALIAFGIFLVIFGGSVFNGLWAAIVGFFLYDSAKSIVAEVGNFEKMTVEEAMMLPTSIAPDAEVMKFVDHILPFHRQTAFPVAEKRELYGILLLEDLKKLPREKWRETKIKEVMRPITPDYFVESDVLLTEAKELMRINGIGALGVIDAKGNLVGFLQRGRIRKRN